MGLKTNLLALTAGLGIWYATHGNLSTKTVPEKYPLPETILVVDSSLNVQYQPSREITEEDIKDSSKIPIEKIIRTKEIDFSENFEIKTERYRLVKDDDWIPSRLVGHILSLPSRLYFWDWDVSNGLDEQRTRAVLSMLETRKDIKDITVRINHNEALYDIYRLFSDPKVQERNNWFARVGIGIPTGLMDELWAELFRGDYYNPMTQTVVTYSNIESIVAHEMGHHQDYQRFTSDWEYALAGYIPGVKLYKEWQASSNAKGIMSADDLSQFDRYLLPAFLTYVLATYYGLKKWVVGKKEE